MNDPEKEFLLYEILSDVTDYSSFKLDNKHSSANKFHALEYTAALPQSCTICYEDILQGEIISFLPVCGRKLHFECQNKYENIEQSTHLNLICPICRT